MADKKQKYVSDRFPVNEELEHHVDELLDPTLPDPVPVDLSKPTGAPDLPTIDIFAGHDDIDADGIADKHAKKPWKKSAKAEAASDAGDQTGKLDASAGSDADGDGMVDAAESDAGVGAVEPEEVPAKVDETIVSANEPPDVTSQELPKETENGITVGNATASEEQLPGYPPIDEDAADEAVDEIVAKESDELLEIQDEAAGLQAPPPAIKTPRRRPSIKAFFGKWWSNKWARYGTLSLLLAGAATAGAMPASRYYLLNAGGVRVGASVTVLDSTTSLPLKNVSVTVGDKTGITNSDGVVRLKELKMGDQLLTVQQIGFAKVEHMVTLGLGSNPLGDTKLKATGIQYKFKLTDYLSDKPVQNAEINSGDANAQADDKGVVVLTLGKIEAPTLTVTITAGGYRSEKMVIDSMKSQLTNVSMVNSRKEVFISKQSGRFDLYKIDIDGKNKQLLLAGTGLERDQMTLVSHPTDGKAALVSSREDKRNGDGYLFDTLTIIDVDKGTTLSLDRSERVQIVDWIGDRLVYVKIKAGTSAGNPDRQQLISYNLANTNRQILASANNFADVVSARGVIYYAASNTFTGGKSYFGKVNPDTSGQVKLQDGEFWNIIRNSYDVFHLAGSSEWYSYKLGEVAAKKLDKAPSNPFETRFYLDAPDGKQALWTENRDGKGVLLAYDAASGKDRTLATQSGLTYPLRWLDGRTAVYRVVSPTESASYVVSLDGGMPRKITDVTNVGGLGRYSYGY